MFTHYIRRSVKSPKRDWKRNLFSLTQKIVKLYHFLFPYRDLSSSEEVTLWWHTTPYKKRTAVLPVSNLNTCLVDWIIELLCFFPILGINTSLYFATIVEFPVPSEGKAVTLWSQNRTLISGACFRQYTASVTTVRFGICSSVSREWTIAKQLSCWKNWTGVKRLNTVVSRTQQNSKFVLCACSFNIFYYLRFLQNWCYYAAQSLLQFNECFLSLRNLFTFISRIANQGSEIPV